MPAGLQYTWSNVAPGASVSILIYGVPQNSFVGWSIEAFNPNAFPGIPGGEPTASLNIQSTVYRDPTSLTTINANILTVKNQSDSVAASIYLSAFWQADG